MNTEHEKYLLAGLIVAVTFHFIILYFIGWLNLAKRQQPEKVLMPVTMLFKPVTEVNTPKAHVAVKHMPRKLHEVKRHTGTIKTGHNKFLSSTSKSPSTAGFSVPQGGKVKAGTVMSHQGESARSTSVANNDLPPIPAFNPMPVIPQNLRTQRYSTSIRVEFIVDEQGAFTIRLLSTTGYDELDREVIATLKKWRFSPATHNGTPVKGTLKMRIQFSVD
ncbi:MAG: energy transducer TonB [Deltaproteobacteria bacterium]|nr:energy transducer TonB [Deltaproteobacteria bacterium]